MQAKTVYTGFLSLLLTGCAGMNGEFEFSKPARDSGIWMAEADEMSAASGVSGINPGDYRLIDTGNIALAPQTVTLPEEEKVVQAGTGTGNPPTVYCNAAHCFPEPAAAFRRPDNVARIWIAPYVSPDNNVHMGEVIYTVASPADWHGMLM
ncbi:type IV conjugative transfer system lipoprotein TraV [Pantoea cypripedii]|uniref:Type IV conjugative transfer system protein TraV n=1 Tax=Pantoea cypripedii TaxID=55209 RepID=A0A6B9GG87_PANCY|nr:type IV conjugative transfer system lipoprotein TraV [Pantoea cypripedii]QGY32535.1 type IV conjugative transfer system protein TraV [Pantoea cypripedii]